MSVCNYEYKALIALSDTRMADTVNYVLASRNIMDVVTVDCTHDAIDAMLHTEFDLFFVDARVPVTFKRSVVLYGGIDYIRFIRMCKGRVSEAVIVFMRQHTDLQNMLETHAEILSARDAGANCSIMHPLTIKKFDTEIVPLLEDPKTFVKSHAYTGPCRRVEDVPVVESRRNEDRDGV